MTLADLLSLLVLAALWGGSFVFVRVAAPVLGPFPLMESRGLFAAPILLAILWARGGRLRLTRNWRSYLVIGFLNAALPFSLFAYAGLHITASLASILNATSPMFGAIIAAFVFGDALTRRKLFGLVLGLVGVVVLVGWSPLPLTAQVVLSCVACLVASCSYAACGAYIQRRVRGIPPLSITTGQQIVLALLLLVPSLLSPPVGPFTPQVMLSVLGLALFSTVVGYVLYFRLIASAGQANALTVTYLVPMFGLLWGVLFLGEPITAATPLGMFMVLASVLLVTGTRIPLPWLAPRA